MNAVWGSHVANDSAPGVDHAILRSKRGKHSLERALRTCGLASLGGLHDAYAATPVASYTILCHGGESILQREVVRLGSNAIWGYRDVCSQLPRPIAQPSAKPGKAFFRARLDGCL